jgi:hypothetical protein
MPTLPVHPAQWLTKIIFQHHNEKLTHRLFRGELDRLAALQTSDVGSNAFSVTFKLMAASSACIWVELNWVSL